MWERPCPQAPWPGGEWEGPVATGPEEYLRAVAWDDDENDQENLVGKFMYDCKDFVNEPNHLASFEAASFKKVCSSMCALEQLV